MNEYTAELIKIVGTLVVGAGIIVTLVAPIKTKENYRGNFYGLEVGYRETMSITDAHDSGSNKNSGSNKMIVKDGTTTYVLVDAAHNKSIKDKDFENQQLELITIQKGQKKNQYKRSGLDKQNLDVQHSKTIFEKGDELYNDLRAKIRTQIEQNYKTIEDKIPQ